MNLNTWQGMLAQAGAPSGAPVGTGGAPTGTAPNPTGQMLQMLVFMGVIGILFIWMIRSQNKKAKDHAAMLKTVKAGDKVITSSGIVGTIVAVKDKTVSMRSAETKLEVLKTAISDITERGGETSSSE